MRYKYTGLKVKPKGAKNWYKFTFLKGNTNYSLRNFKRRKSK